MKKMISLWIAFIMLTVLTQASCIDSKIMIIPNKDIQEYTSSEMISVFEKNKDLFNEVAEVVLKNDSILKEIIENSDDDEGIYTNTDKRFFTDEEWSYIQKLFETTGPYQIMRSIKFGHDLVYFVFEAEKETDGYYLFYVPNGDEVSVNDYLRKTDTKEQIDITWWLVCRTQES